MIDRNVESYTGSEGGCGLIQQVFDVLLGFGYIKTDSDFADNFVERSISNQYGLGYVKTQLSKKGISNNFIEEAIEKVLASKHVDFNLSAKERLESRYCSGLGDTTREKVVSQLRKWGFSSSECKYAIDSHPDNENLKTKIQVKGSRLNIENEVLKLARKLKGKHAISSALKAKCVDISGLNELISKLEIDGAVDFFEMAKDRLSKKRYDLLSQKGKSSAYCHLSMNGFSTEQIKYAIDALVE